MRDYYFWYIKGTSRPEGHVRAEDDNDFLTYKLPKFLNRHNGTLDNHASIVWQESGIIPMDTARRAFVSARQSGINFA